MVQSAKHKRGFSLVELIVGVAVFTIIVASVYGAYMSIYDVVKASRAKIEAVSLVNEQLEIARNLPYADVGISGGVPTGKLAHTQTITRNAYTYTVTTTVRNIDDPFDGTLGGTPNDTAPADYKLVEIQVDCAMCKGWTPMIVTTRVAPKNLETASTNGALVVRVFDSGGNPVQDASVHIENNVITPHIVIDDVTDNMGILRVVDAPPGTNAYEITVTKSGYSTDRTYASTVGNPNPTKPHATVLLQQVTTLSFTIDRLSTLNVSSVTSLCNAVSSMDFSLSGAKLIGTPSVLKYSQNKITDSSGLLSIGSLEWDTYSILGIDSVYDVIGVNPLSPIGLTPSSTQSAQIIVQPKNPNTVLVVVRDGATGLPLSGVTVELENGGSYDLLNTTGQGFVQQTDWSGGSGQATSTIATKYFSSDGNIETASPAGSLTLKKVFGQYVSSGVLTSSSFDTGGGINFQQINWTPVDQPSGSGSPNVRMQIATNNDGGTWNYFGPDGTSATYYTTANNNINAVHNGNRYLRYKLYLNTASTSVAPNISNVSFTYTSSCTPPGQVYFDGVSTGSYTLHLDKTGYASQDISVSVSSSWKEVDVTMLAN